MAPGGSLLVGSVQPEAPEEEHQGESTEVSRDGLHEREKVILKRNGWIYSRKEQTLDLCACGSAWS